MAIGVRDIDIGISMTGHDLKFIETNSAFQAMLGYSAEELRDLSPVDLMVEEEREAAARAWWSFERASGPTTRS